MFAGIAVKLTLKEYLSSVSTCSSNAFGKEAISFVLVITAFIVLAVCFSFRSLVLVLFYLLFL
ncbi:hypothetical protein MNB_SM-4-1160 [hydrothermal vent metagenome]|uniref:Uncharacterized protein n=1 Tax=hydrothermal vent metagenome TaxID=652676 RepID=A0A1W1CEW6_9ZZZZ